MTSNQVSTFSLNNKKDFMSPNELRPLNYERLTFKNLNTTQGFIDLLYLGLIFTAKSFLQ